MTLCMIVAVSENGVIGRGNDLPWRLPDDLKRFKALTLGHPMVMGRRTYESIGRPLPGRTSVVLTRNPDFAAEGVTVVRSWEEALAACAGAERAFVIGGASLYRRALDECERIYLTRVHAQVEGDTRFPDGALDRFRLVRGERHPADARHPYPFTFQDYERA